MDTTITTLEMCAGYGGIGLGLKNIFGERLRTIAYCELEGFAQANLISKMEKGLLDAAPIWSDLKTFPYESFHGLVDILIAGYPCQPFSAAGKRAGKDDPRHLWPWIADGIRVLRPRACFLENVEGHISLGLSTVISDLEELGYKVSWGIFSASEVGAPHQRKRVFILAYRSGEGFPRHRGFEQVGLPQGWESEKGCSSKGGGLSSTGILWPSRPGEHQHAWEPPRVVANSERGRGEEPEHQHANLPSEPSGGYAEAMGNATSERPGTLGAEPTGQQRQASTSSAGDAMGNASQREDNGRESRDLGQATGEGRCGDDAADGAGEVLADTSIVRCDGRPNGISGRIWEPGEVSEDATGCGGEGNGMRQAQSALGLHSDESSSFLGQALTLNPYGDNVYAYENISKKIRAREVLFSVWREAISKEIQWTAGGLQYFLAEKVLQSGMQLDAFTQRICYFVWCIQTGHKAQGWGLHGMWVYETCGNSSQGQKPIEQLQRELGYSMCQLSYEIALGGRKDDVEAESILQGVREASERAWALSQALPEMEEVWRSSLDQKVWEKGCYIEATSIGNRTDELRLLGNGVVPATAERAFLTLIKELNT